MMTGTVLLAISLVQGAASGTRTETFWQKVLRIAGISATPSGLRGPQDAFDGEVWVVETAGTPAARRIAPEAGYRSPVFEPGGQAVLALRGDDLLRIALSSGKVSKLGTLAGVAKLVGFSKDAPPELLVLVAGTGGGVQPALWNLTSGVLAPLPFDASSKEDRDMLNHLEEWERVYGDWRVYTRAVSSQGLAGPRRVSEVFLKHGSETPVNVSRCGAVNCGQPSLSPDNRLVVFVRSAE